MGHDTSDHGKYSYIYIFLILLNLDTICLIGRHERKNHWNFGIPVYSWEIDDTKFYCSQPVVACRILNFITLEFIVDLVIE